VYASAGRAGADSGSPPIFSGNTSNVEAQPVTMSSIKAAAGAAVYHRAFRFMRSSSYTAMHNKISIGEDGFEQVYAQ
jgi:hypothetical protein